ncbi:MAG: SidA/IucD/PvdA family monooxygenase [Chloroflexota bacterium]
MLDWLILGGGIHGTHIAHVLTTTGTVAPNQIRVLDPAGEPLARWNHLTRNTGMEFMRSPSVHHLGVKADELNKFSRTPNGIGYREFRYPYGRPAYDLFQAHNRHLVEQHRLDQLWLQGKALRLSKRRHSWDVHTDRGKLSARRILLALGRTNMAWPAWSSELRMAAHRVSVHHLFEESFEMAAVPPWRHLVVIGGGISAAQVACSLGERAKKDRFNGRVTLLTRHPLRKSHFDSNPCWNGPKCLTKFHHTADYTQRRAQITEGRYRGTVSHDVIRVVERHCEEETLHLRQDQVIAAHLPPSQPGASLEICLQLASGATITTDRVILATGFEQRRPGGDLIDKAIAAHGLRCALCGYPIVDPQLQWHEGLHVTGPLAELELGTTAPNIRGARMAVDRLQAAVL